MKLLRETRGAVYVEFLAVFLPLFIFFLSLVQLIFVQTASLVVSHAAMTAARAAAVIAPDDPAYYGGAGVGTLGGAKKNDVIKAAAIPLSALGPEGEGLTVDVGGAYAKDAMITVKLKYDYKCRVPGGALFVCGFGGTKTISAEAAMRNQGAEYVYGN